MDKTDFATPGCLPKPRVSHLIPRDASDRDRDDTRSVALFLKTTGPPPRPADTPLSRRSISYKPPRRLVKRFSAQKQNRSKDWLTNGRVTAASQTDGVVECVSESGARFFQIVPKELAENIDVMPDCELVNFSYNSTARTSFDMPRRHLSSASSLRPDSSPRPLVSFRNRVVANSKDLDSFAEAIDETNSPLQDDEEMPDTASLLKRPFSRQDRVDHTRGKILTEHITRLQDSSTSKVHALDTSQTTTDRHLLALSSNARVQTPIHFNGGVTDARAALRSNPTKSAPDRPLPDLPENKRLSTGSRSQHIDEALETLRKSSIRISASLQEAKMDKASNQGRRRVSRDMYQVAGPLLYSGTTKASLSSHASSTDSTVNDHYYHSTMDATDSFSRHLAEISKPRTSFTPRYSSLKRTGGFPDLSGQNIGRHRPASNARSPSPSSSPRLPSLTESSSTVPGSGHARVNSNSSDTVPKAPHRREKYEKARARKLKDLHKSRPSIDRVFNAANRGSGMDSSVVAHERASPSVNAPMADSLSSSPTRPLANTHEKLDALTANDSSSTRKPLQSIWNSSHVRSSDTTTSSGDVIHTDQKANTSGLPSTPQIDDPQSQSRFSNSTATTGFSPGTELTFPSVQVDVSDSTQSNKPVVIVNEAPVRQGPYMRDMTNTEVAGDHTRSQQQPRSVSNRVSLAQAFPGGLTPSPSIPHFHTSHSHLSHLISESSFDPNPFYDDENDSTLQSFPSFTSVQTQPSVNGKDVVRTENEDKAAGSVQPAQAQSVTFNQLRPHRDLTPLSMPFSSALNGKDETTSSTLPRPFKAASPINVSSKSAQGNTSSSAANASAHTPSAVNGVLRSSLSSTTSKRTSSSIAVPSSVPATTSNSSAAPIFSAQSRLEARIDLLERENKLLEAALMAVLKTSGKLNGCLCGGTCPGSLNKSVSLGNVGKGQAGQSTQDAQGALGMYLRTRRGGSVGALTGVLDSLGVNDQVAAAGAPKALATAGLIDTSQSRKIEAGNNTHADIPEQATKDSSDMITENHDEKTNGHAAERGNERPSSQSTESRAAALRNSDSMILPKPAEPGATEYRVVSAGSTGYQLDDITPRTEVSTGSKLVDTQTAAPRSMPGSDGNVQQPNGMQS